MAKSVDCLAEVEMGSGQTAESQNPQEANIIDENMAIKGSEGKDIPFSDTNLQLTS